jgi:hypothetical protein
MRASNCCHVVLLGRRGNGGVRKRCLELKKLKEGGERPKPRVREEEALSVRPSKKVREVSHGSCTDGGVETVSQALLWERTAHKR